jgi:hypothetical protein
MTTGSLDRLVAAARTTYASLDSEAWRLLFEACGLLGHALGLVPALPVALDH